jgi:hypothetical protein
MTMKRNLTLAVEEEILNQARLIAAHKKRTLTGMIRKYLQTMVKKDRKNKVSLDCLIKAMKSKPLTVGRSSWRRYDLHAR